MSLFSAADSLEKTVSNCQINKEFSLILPFSPGGQLLGKLCQGNHGVLRTECFFFFLSRVQVLSHPKAPSQLRHYLHSGLSPQTALSACQGSLSPHIYHTWGTLYHISCYGYPRPLYSGCSATFPSLFLTIFVQLSLSTRLWVSRNWYWVSSLIESS